MQRFRKLFAVLAAALVCVGVAAIALFTAASNSAVAQAPCPANLIDAATLEERERCTAEKEKRDERENQQLYETAQADPQADEPVPTYDPEIYGTVVPDGFVPNAHGEKVYPIGHEELGDTHLFDNKNSVWVLGSAPDLETGYKTVFACATVRVDETPATIGLAVVYEGGRAYNQTWDLPHDIASITITGASDLDTSGAQPIGMVYFVTDTGLKGMVDLAKGVVTMQ